METTNLVQFLFITATLLLPASPATAVSDISYDSKSLLCQSVPDQLPGKRDKNPFDEELTDLYNPYSDNTTTFRRFFSVGRYERALALEASGDITHDNSKFVDVIACQYLLGRYNEAIATCEKWLSVNKAAPKRLLGFVYEFIGNCHSEKFELQLAIDAFTRAKELDGSRDEAYQIENARDLLAVKNGKLSKKEFVEKGVKDRRSRLNSSQHDLSEIRRLFGAPFVEIPLVEKFPGVGKEEAFTKASTLSRQAKKLDLANEFEQAAKLYKESLNIYGSDSSTWSAYALCVMMTFDRNSDREDEIRGVAETKNALQKATQLSPKDWRTWNNLGIYMGKEDGDSIARTAFETALRCSDVPEFQQEQLRKDLRIYSSIDMLKKHYEHKN